MGTDDLFHKRKARKAESHRREKAKRAPYERVLIVCEGIQTEPNYFGGLCRELGLPPVNVIIEDKKSGLDPKGLVALQQSKTPNCWKIFIKPVGRTIHRPISINWLSI